MRGGGDSLLPEVAAGFGRSAAGAASFCSLSVMVSIQEKSLVMAQRLLFNAISTILWRSSSLMPLPAAPEEAMQMNTRKDCVARKHCSDIPVSVEIGV